MTQKEIDTKFEIAKILVKHLECDTSKVLSPLYDYLQEQLPIHSVGKSFKTELEMHEIATEKYHEHNYGDAKYDGFMECYKMLVKDNNPKTDLSK